MYIYLQVIVILRTTVTCMVIVVMHVYIKTNVMFIIKESKMKVQCDAAYVIVWVNN